jgi:hypothetical protein
VRHEARARTVRPRWLTISEGGMSSPAPSAGHVFKCASVKLAVHEQRDLNLSGQRRRTGFLQE